mmetsp:Transcript_39560/g.64159  ORF Transcript_39560/g.64159 Transcript_39560/m.64159 type:complete len:216 (-) Transcript_39560:334-981(-)
MLRLASYFRSAVTPRIGNLAILQARQVRNSCQTVEASEIRVGHFVQRKGKLWQIIKTSQTGYGRGSSYIQAELRDLEYGVKSNERFRTSELVERVFLEAKTYQYLYIQGDQVVLMDTSTYDQVHLPTKLMGDAAAYLQEGMELSVMMDDEKPTIVKLPAIVAVTVEDTSAPEASAKASYKPSTLTNGRKVMVPSFIGPGDKIRVRVEDEAYVDRV